MAIAWHMRGLLYSSFDPIVARAAGLNVVFLDNLLLVLLALTIVVSLESIGIILVAALLVTPAAAAAQVNHRFAPMLVTSLGIGIGSCVVGLYVSYYAGSASGATIVLLATITFFALLAVGRRRARAGLAVAGPVNSGYGERADRP
jgi:manganese/iron transport system permease protein